MIPQWLLSSFAFMVAIMVGVVWIWVKRHQNAEMVKNKVLVEIYTNIGTTTKFMLSRDATDSSLLRIPLKEGQKSQETYALRKDAMFDCMLPEGTFSFLKVPGKKIVFKEGDAEPAIKRWNVPITSASKLGAQLDQQARALAIQYTLDVKEQQNILKHLPDKTILYILCGAGCACAGVAAFFGYMVYTMGEKIMISLGLE